MVISELSEFSTPSSTLSEHYSQHRKNQYLLYIGKRQKKHNNYSNIDNRADNLKTKDRNNSDNDNNNNNFLSNFIFNNRIIATNRNYVRISLYGNHSLRPALNTPKHRTEGIVRLVLVAAMICQCFFALTGADSTFTTLSVDEELTTKRPPRLSSSSESDEVFVPDRQLRMKVLQNIQRSLEYYSSITARNLLKKAAQHKKNSKNLNDEHRTNSDNSSDAKSKVEHLHRFDPADFENAEDNGENSAEQQNSDLNSREIDNVGLIGNGSNVFGNFLRVRVGLRETRGKKFENSLEPSSNDTEIISNADEVKPHNPAHHLNELAEAPTPQVSMIALSDEISSTITPDEIMDINASSLSTKRRLRSASTRVAYSNLNGNSNVQNQHLHRHHHLRRRRKGCPPLHGKDQLLCPSRNSHRYDVCVTREQLCNHIEDCPNGEDEDPSQCFFYKPLDDHLKTLSHAVLLLAESVMSEQQHHRAKSSIRADDL